MRKGEKAYHKESLLFSQCFLQLYIFVQKCQPFSTYFYRLLLTYQLSPYLESCNSKLTKLQEFEGSKLKSGSEIPNLTLQVLQLTCDGAFWYFYKQNVVYFCLSRLKQNHVIPDRNNDLYKCVFIGLRK